VNLDPEKLLMLFAIALVVMGPQRLPQAARGLGRGLAEVKRYRSMLQSEVGGILDEPRSMVRSAIREANLSDAGRPAASPGPSLIVGPGATQAAAASSAPEDPDLN
jgi:sec-independent protein translocase protein TatA